uniref:Uncharacterized protein n=1 Tax=Knipowitschia caucasica TaxID=637954 RepID=A0AAV2J5U3_KNICA
MGQYNRTTAATTTFKAILCSSERLNRIHKTTIENPPLARLHCLLYSAGAPCLASSAVRPSVCSRVTPIHVSSSKPNKVSVRPAQTPQLLSGSAPPHPAAVKRKDNLLTPKTPWTCARATRAPGPRARTTGQGVNRLQGGEVRERMD